MPYKVQKKCLQKKETDKRSKNAEEWTLQLLHE
jgi:hypothetical protein